MNPISATLASNFSAATNATGTTGAAPIRIAVVGHTNAGKTSLLRTLIRRVDFGEVSDRPGTTRHVERVELRIDGRAAGVQFFDTPGLEDAVALQEHIRTHFAADPAILPAEQVRRFLAGPEAHRVFEQEAKVLRTLLDCDAAFLVIDVRTPVLPKYRAEIGLLAACARPVLPVLNFVRQAMAGGGEAPWRALLADAGLHAVARFDATAPFTGAERELYQDLATLLPAHRQTIAGIVQRLEAERAARRDAACAEIARLLLRTAAMRRDVVMPEPGSPLARPASDGSPLPPATRIGVEDEPAVDGAIQQAMRAAALALRQDVLRCAASCTRSLLDLYGFRTDDADEAPLPPLHGRWEMDLFNTDTLRQAGKRLGAGTAMGVAVGLMADIALGGASLGAGMALGAAAGGALAHGWGPLGRRMAARMRGIREVTVEDAVLLVLAQRQIALVRALEQRGHAAMVAMETIGSGDTASSPRNGTSTDTSMHISTNTATGAAGNPTAETASDSALRAVRATRIARSHPQWEEMKVGTPDAQAATDEVAEALAAAFRG